MTKEEFIAALGDLETQIKDAFGGMSGNPSPQGHDREMALAITKLEESMMWMRRAIERKFA